MDQQNYQLFDSDDREFSLVLTSNANIKKVCKVLTQCAFKSHEERVYYAEMGDIAPEREEDGTLVYNFENVYTSNAVASAVLADRLFYEFPDLGDIPNVDEDLFGRLIRSEVWRAFEDWLGKFGENPFEVTALLNTLAANPSLTSIIQTMSDLRTAGSTSTDSTEIQGDGSRASSLATESGQRSSS